MRQGMTIDEILERSDRQIESGHRHVIHSLQMMGLSDDFEPFQAYRKSRDQDEDRDQAFARCVEELKKRGDW